MSCRRRRSWPPPRDLQGLCRRGARRRGEGPGRHRGGASWMKPVRAGLRRRPPPEVKATYSHPLPEEGDKGRMGSPAFEDLCCLPLPLPPSLASTTSSIAAGFTDAGGAPCRLCLRGGTGARTVGAAGRPSHRILHGRTRQEAEEEVEVEGAASVPLVLRMRRRRIRPVQGGEAALDSPGTAARKMRTSRGEERRERELCGGHGGQRRISGKSRVGTERVGETRRRDGRGELGGIRWRKELGQAR
jgi:hypothetical protein